MDNNLKKMLERLSETNNIDPAIKDSVGEIMDILLAAKCAAWEVETKLKILDEDLGVKQMRNPINNVKSRIKEVSSILVKLDRKKLRYNKENIEENISDIAGIRVICSYTDDIYEVAKMLISQDDIYLIETKDYIANPKPNGYRSLHLIVGVPVFFSNEKKIVKVEVQIRTIAMEFWAELEHTLKYKKDYIEADVIDELKECADDIARSDERMLRLRNRINSSRKQV